MSRKIQIKAGNQLVLSLNTQAGKKWVKKSASKNVLIFKGALFFSKETEHEVCKFLN
jgi:hypothetical protein